MYAVNTMDREEYRRIRRARAIKQQRARRKAIFLLAVTFMIMFGIGMGFGTLLTRAESPAKEPSYKYYANIEIQSGDTLWDISEEYMDTEHYMTRTDYMNEVMKINGMTDDKLVSGQKIIVPYYSYELQ